MSSENVHSGHRERVRQRIEKGSFECLSDIEMLEYMLFFSIPRADTNVLAHKLIDYFGSFERVIEATAQELLAVDGIGNKSAQLLSSYLPVFRFYHQCCIKSDKLTFDQSEKVLQYFQNITLGEQVEHAYAMYLNHSKRIIKVVHFSRGTYNETQIFIDQVVKEAITHNARYVILAHNHTAGSCFPSEADMATAKQLYHALELVKKELLDFAIVDHFDGFSFVENNIITPDGIRDIYARPNQTYSRVEPAKSRTIQDDDDF
ncbi:MAG: RadC family protein [Clostridia bacterium]|nr:RadC family protein [Clostridia bacterium]